MSKIGKVKLAQVSLSKTKPVCSSCFLENSVLIFSKPAVLTQIYATISAHAYRLSTTSDSGCSGSVMQKTGSVLMWKTLSDPRIDAHALFLVFKDFTFTVDPINAVFCISPRSRFSFTDERCELVKCPRSLGPRENAQNNRPQRDLIFTMVCQYLMSCA